MPEGIPAVVEVLNELGLPVATLYNATPEAELGLCLHRSASGVDLPIKLAEMRGCAVPAVVLDYGDVLREVVPEAVFFKTAESARDRAVTLTEPIKDEGKHVRGDALTRVALRAN